MRHHQDLGDAVRGIEKLRCGSVMGIIYTTIGSISMMHTIYILQYYSHAAIPQPPRLDLIRCTQNVLDVECRPPYQFHPRPGVIRVVPHDDAAGGGCGCGGGGGAAHDEHVDEEEELRTVLVSRGEGGRPFRIRGLANDLSSSDICYDI